MMGKLQDDLIFVFEHQNLVFGLIAFTCVYFIVGMVLYIRNIDAIVIKNRLPKIVIMEQANVFIVLIATLLPFIKEVHHHISCEMYQLVVSMSLSVIFILILVRMSFVYKYLMNKEDTQAIGLLLICKLFWDENNNIRTRSLRNMIFVVNLICFLNIVIYDAVVKQYWHSLDDCHGEAVLFITLFNYIVILLNILFTIQILRFKIRDKIWLSYEIVGYTIGLLSVILITQSLHGFVSTFTVYFESMIAIFFGLYFPFLAILNHKRHLRSNISRKSLINDEVKELCIKFYCEENALFIESYEKHLKGLLDVSYLVVMFIQSDAPLILNINYELRCKALSNDLEIQKLGLREIYNEINQLIRINILPYIKCT